MINRTKKAMKLIDLIKLCNTGYQKDFPESDLTEQVDANGQPLNPPAGGDTLARFVVVELAETFDENASDKDQLDTAFNSIQKAINDLTNILVVLEEQPSYQETP